MTWDDAIAVLDGWEGRDVLVVPFLSPGLSLEPTLAPLVLERPERGVVRLDLPRMPIALRRATFIEAGWVPGQHERGLSVVQGGVRVDVFLERRRAPRPRLGEGVVDHHADRDGDHGGEGEQGAHVSG